MDQVSLRLFHSDFVGKPYRRLSALSSSLKTKKIKPLMLMNGGMYHSDLAPVGLYIEKRKQVQKLSTKGGWGNFHLLPNGVFWINGNQAHVSETKSFQRRGIVPDFATQSGPMLVINGKLHPRFLKASDSVKIRNGVGVSADGKTIYFAISHSTINFWDFGTLFQKELKTPNALFLDGTVSALSAPGVSRGGWRELGPMIGVFARGS